MVVFLSKPTESDRFEQILDFLNAYPIRFALTVNPTIYISCIEQFYSTAMAITINGEAQLLAKVDGKKIIVTKSFVIADEEGIDCLPDSIIFEQIALLGFVKTFLDTQLNDLSTHKRIYIAPSHCKKIFGNMRRVGKGFLTQKPKKPKRKDTQEPQPSGHTESIVDEAVHKESGDRLVRAATTASSLEAKHDSGNTLRSDEDILKFDELMALCINLQNGVLDLEKTKTNQQNKIATQQQEIASLKRRVKKLEKRNKSRTHKLKRLYKVSLSARVESSSDEESLGKDASKQGRRIDAIDSDKDITLVSIQDDADKEMFDVDTLVSDEVFVAGQNENVVEEVVDAAQVSTAATTVIVTTKEITLAQALEALKTSKPKVKGIVFQGPGKSTTTTTISSQQSHDKGKGIMIEEPVKPKKKDQIMLDEEAALKLQAKFDEE
nr:hypothetical protein [Tanacetum cinerariifolium]